MKKKIIISILSVFSFLLLSLITFCIIFGGRVSSMFSIKNVGDSLYTMNYKQDYHLDKALNAEIKNEDQLLDFICDDMLFGYKIDGNTTKYACSAFTTKTPDDKNLVGRSFDLGGGSDTLSLYTHPKGDYASISTISTDMIGVGDGGDYSTTGLFGRIALLAAPYMGMDGVNEKGLSISLLDMDYTGVTHQVTDNPDMFITIAVRLLLDRAATVDEAIDLLYNHDIHTSHHCTQHMFIADRNGNSAVVEWVAREMKVVKYPVCTNFRLSLDYASGDYSNNCDRFDFLENSLKKKQKNTVEDAMKLLEGVKQNHTRWAVVYNLTDFTADYVIDKNYSKTYHLEPYKY